MNKVGYYVLLFLTGVLLLQQCGGDGPKEEVPNEPIPSLEIILDGEEISTVEIDARKSKLVDQWAGTVVGAINVRIEPEATQSGLPRYLHPYSELPLRYYLEDLIELERYSSAPKGSLQGRQKNIPALSIPDEYFEEFRYSLVRRLMSFDRLYLRYSDDTMSVFNPYYQELRTDKIFTGSQYTAFLKLYNFLLTNKGEAPFFEYVSTRWRKSLRYEYIGLTEILTDSLYPLVITREEIENDLFFEEESIGYQRHKVAEFMNSSRGYVKLSAAFDQLAQIPLPAGIHEKIDQLRQSTQQDADNLAMETAQLQAAYDTTASRLSEPERQLFQQVFVHCKEVEQVLRKLAKRLLPYQIERVGQISMLSLTDVLEAINQVMYSDQFDKYSEIESYLYEIREDYYKRVRQAEATFLRR